MDEEEEFSKLSSAGNSWYCPSCCVTMTAESQAREHVTGWKHLRRQRMLASALCSPLQRTFDARAKDKIGRIICIGDCHTRSSQLMSPLAKSFFYGGSIYSWACETTSGRIRKVPPLASLLSRQDKDRILGGSGRSLLVIWSYGEIDVRMHSSLWREKSDGMDACALRGEKEEGEPAGSTALSLTRGYVRAVLAAAAACRESLLVDDVRQEASREVNVLSVILAVPPPTAGGQNLKAPFVGALSERVTATQELNRAISRACNDANEASSSKCLAPSLIFTGEDTWTFAMVSSSDEYHNDEAQAATGAATVPGSLRSDISDGHVHVRADFCAPIHDRIRELVARKLF